MCGFISSIVASVMIEDPYIRPSLKGKGKKELYTQDYENVTHVHCLPSHNDYRSVHCVATAIIVQFIAGHYIS